MRLCIITQTVDSTDPVLGFFHAWIVAFAARCEQVTVVCLKEGVHDLPSNVLVLSLGKEERIPSSPDLSLVEGARLSHAPHVEKSDAMVSPPRSKGRGGEGWYVRSRARLYYLVRFYKHLWRKRHAYDTVFVHMNPEYVVLGAPLWCVLRKRVALWYTHKAVTMWLRIAVRFAHVIFTASKESFRIPSAKVRVVGHGIDTELFRFPLPIPSVLKGERTVVSSPLSRGRLGGGGVVRLVCVGRISRTKRQDLAIETLTRVRTQGTDAHLTVIGTPLTDADRVYERELHALVQECQLTGVVHWVGGVSQSDLPRHLVAADVFVHTSETGSLDKVVLEALAAGCTLVTTSAAVRDALPPDLQRVSYVEATPEALATFIAMQDNGIERVRYRDLGREFVVAHHALPGLVERIVGALEA